MNRLNLWEGGGIMTAAEWRANLWRTVKSGWYAFLVPGIIFYGIFSGRLTPTEAGAVAVVVTIIIGFILGTLKFSDFPGHAGQLRQGERCDPADHRLLHPAGRGAGDHRRAAGLRRCADLDDQNEYMLIADDGADPRRRGLRDGDDAQHRDPRADPLPAGAGDRDEPDPVLHHDDHRAGRGLHHAAAGLNLFVVSGITGESILKIAYRAIPFVFFMLIVTLMIAYIPAFSTSLLPDVYR
jgi:C4-dicarboxylate transporter DctM subunit